MPPFWCPLPYPPVCGSGIGFPYPPVPYPPLQNFDAPNGDFSCVRRARSNTPLQALTLLNEPIALDCARSLAALTLKEGGADDAARITYAFRRCVARKPAAEELAVLSSLLKRQAERFAAGEVDPRELATDQSGTGAAPVQLASWTVLARVLLNLDETITKE